MIRSSVEEFITFKVQEQDKGIQVRYENETLWMTQKSIAELFDVGRSAITKHLSNIFNEQELDKNAVCSKMEHTAEDGKNYQTEFYNLDAIISVGYRVNSIRATQFRRWATNILKTFTIQGYVLDKERMKNGSFIDKDYFEKLLEEIREIRLSERRFYQKITDIYATSVDYDRKSPITIEFFKKIQNKMHYATHGHTAAEVIYARADANKPFMGLTTFSGDFPTMQDVTVAKNYLTEDELAILNRIVSGYFDFAEVQAMRHNPMYMSDYVEHLDNLLKTTGEGVLIGAGTVSHTQAIEKAKAEYRKFQVQNLSPVEKAYLDSIRSIEQTAKKKEREARGGGK